MYGIYLISTYASMQSYHIQALNTYHYRSPSAQFNAMHSMHVLCNITWLTLLYQSYCSSKFVIYFVHTHIEIQKGNVSSIGLHYLFHAMSMMYEWMWRTKYVEVGLI